MPPQIQCPADIVRECTGNQSATVTPDTATGSDLCLVDVAISNPETRSFGLGSHQLAYTATDSQGLVSSCTSALEVRDTTPPEINAVIPSTAVLWPPDHSMRSVTIAVETMDICDSVAPVCRITRIASSEARDGTGDGNTLDDWSWNPAQSGTSFDLELRAERDGSGTGRTYTVGIECSDESGNLSTSEATGLCILKNRDF